MIALGVAVEAAARTILLRSFIRTQVYADSICMRSITAQIDRICNCALLDDAGRSKGNLGGVFLDMGPGARKKLQQPDGCPSEECFDVLDDVTEPRPVGTVGNVSDVGGGQHVGKCPEPVTTLERLGTEYI